MLLVVPIFPGHAADLYESEYNDTMSNADVTYDDYNNYGAITSISDNDCWTITFSQGGMANFWLGNVPSTCSYGIFLYESDGYTEMTSSNLGVGAGGLIRARVYAGIPYYVRIVTYSGYSSSKYLFRVKNYPLNDAKIFTFSTDSYSTRESGEKVLPYFQSMGYTSSEVVNSMAAPGHTALTTSDIWVTHDHGAPGIMYFTNSELYANSNSSMTGVDRAISTYAYEGISTVDLVLFCGCETGGTDSTYGNLVDIARSKGARCCIGWTGINKTADATKWLEQFFYYLSSGYTVAEARSSTNSWIKDVALDYSTISSQYYGSSQLSSLILG